MVDDSRSKELLCFLGLYVLSCPCTIEGFWMVHGSRCLREIFSQRKPFHFKFWGNPLKVLGSTVQQRSLGLGDIKKEKVFVVGFPSHTLTKKIQVKIWICPRFPVSLHLGWVSCPFLALVFWPSFRSHAESTCPVLPAVFALVHRARLQDRARNCCSSHPWPRVESGFPDLF